MRRKIALQIYIIHRLGRFVVSIETESSYTGIKAITRQWGQAPNTAESVKESNGMSERKDTANADKRARQNVSITHKGWLPFASEIHAFLKSPKKKKELRAIYGIFYSSYETSLNFSLLMKIVCE